MTVLQRLKKDEKHVVSCTEMAVSYQINTRPNDRDCLKTALQVYNYILPFYGMDLELRERMYAIYLNNANQVLGVYRLSDGGINTTICDIRLVFSIALTALATAVILVHNHPSSSLKPSRQDKELNRRVKQASEFLQINFLDNIIVSEAGYYSFAEEGEL